MCPDDSDANCERLRVELCHQDGRDVDGTVSLSVGSNVITVEVTAEDGSTTRTYTVTVTRDELGAEEAEEEMEQRLMGQYGANDSGVIGGNEILEAVLDFFAGVLTGNETLTLVDTNFAD